MSQVYFANLEKLSEDKIRGAMEIAESALSIIDSEIRTNTSFWKKCSISEILSNLKPILDINPNMIILRNLVLEFLSFLENEVNIEEILGIQKEKIENSKKILARDISQIIFEEETIVTFSRASTILTSLKYGKKEYNKSLEVILFESRPKNEGKLLAKELIEIGVN